MKAMLLAAGLGTRLKPLTNHTPKCLIPVNGIPLIFYNLALLKKQGIRKVVINLHHLGGQIKKLLGSGEKFGLKIQYSHEPKILGTGGGIKKAQKFLKKGPFLVFNADIITDINLKELIAFHRKKRPFATLVVKQSPAAKKYGILYVDDKNHIASILHKPLKGLKTRETFFTGVHVLDERFLNYQKPQRKSCIIRDGYIPLLNEGEKIGGYLQKGYWSDLGTHNSLKKTDENLRKKKIRLTYNNYLKDFRKILAQKN